MSGMTAGDRLMRPFPEPLRLAAREVSELAQLSQSIQNLIASLVAREAAPHTALLVQGQSADLLSQRLAGVAAFLEALAEAAPEETTVDVAAAVMGLFLAEQAHHFTGQVRAPSPADCNSGDLMLFED